jgi:uncharacterized protein YbjT (DUF2867 family)
MVKSPTCGISTILPFPTCRTARLTGACFPADAAKASGGHLVFTSVGSANRHTGIPHFDSKYEVEKHTAKVGVRATILAPVSFTKPASFVRH